jgi:hypothetical protein
VAIVALRASRVVGLLCLLGLGGWLALSVYNASQGNVVPVLPAMISGQQAELNQLSATRVYLSQWDKILSPRSQAWSAMDFFLALLPEGKDVVCDRLRYAIRPATNAGKGPGGFAREWIIEGSCTDPGRAHLEKLREAAAIAEIFTATAVRLSEPSFALSDDRTVKAVLREESNPQFAAANATGAAGVLPYQFRLVVTQTIDGGDPLAFPQLPKPQPKTGKPAS